jgi:hypothetical protein
MSSDDTTAGPDTEAADTSAFREYYAEMERLLDEIEDPLDAEGVSAGHVRMVGEQLGNALAQTRRGHHSSSREAHRQAAEFTEGPDYLTGTLAVRRAAADGLPDIEEPHVVDESGRPVVHGETPITPVERVRLTALDDGGFHDVYVLNESDAAGEYGPRADGSDSPLVRKYHRNADCPNTDFSARAYSLAGVGSAKDGPAVPCPSCILRWGDMQEALEHAPALSDIPKGEGSDRVAQHTSGVDSNERDRMRKIAAYLTRNASATVDDLAGRYGLSVEQAEKDLTAMESAGAVAYSQGDSGETEYRLVGTGGGDRR